jgi:hypothetical protein
VVISIDLEAGPTLRKYFRKQMASNDRIPTCKKSRLKLSNTFCLIPPAVMLYSTAALSTVDIGACWFSRSSIAFIWSATSYPAIKSVGPQRSAPGAATSIQSF